MLENTLLETQKNQNIAILPEEKAFHQTALTKFMQIMRWQEGQSVKSWVENLLEQLVPFVKGLQGTLYNADNQAETISLVGAFAIDDSQQLQTTYQYGEGLLGQVAMNREMLFLQNQDRFASISATQKIRLKAIFMQPLVYNDKLIGVIEVIFPQAPAERYTQFLQTISESIANTLHVLSKEIELADSLYKIKASEERLKRLSEVTTEGIAFLDKKNTIAEYNEAFAKIFNYKNEDFFGKKINYFFRLSDETLQNTALPIEVEILLENQEIQYLEVESRPMPQHPIFSQIISIRDISNRKNTENRLQSTQKQLAEAQKIVELSDIIRKKNKNITASIQYAKRIQDALLPEKEIFFKLFPESFIFFRPRDIVSGDFYWFEEITIPYKKQPLTVIACVDCTGHGVPGAIMSMAGSIFLKQIILMQEKISPNDILEELHISIVKALKQQETHNRDGMDITICVVDRDENILHFAGAKNPIWIVRDNKIVEIEGNNVPVGGYLNKNEKKRFFTKKQIPFTKYDTFYLSTDGYQDQFGGEDGRKFMKTRFKELLCQISALPFAEQAQQLAYQFESWQNTEKQTDDVLVMGWKV
jgi:PAS domain S-box-containing protein